MTRKARAVRIAFYLGLLGLWQAVSAAGLLNPFVIPPPSKVVSSFAGLVMSGEIFLHVAASLGRVGVGYAISLMTAIPLGLALGWSRRTRFYFGPLLAVLRPIPPLAWVPLTILWFGLGNGPSFFITMVASFFPILLNTEAGVANIEPRYLEVARGLGATPRMILLEVVLPAASPFIFSGMRIGLTVAWMSVVAAEMVAATRGLGYFIELKQEMVQTELVISGMIAIAACGIALDRALLLLEGRWVSWQPRTAQSR